jgi:hypothetical protein
MTTQKVVADGRSDAEKVGLVQIKKNEIDRRVKDGTLQLDAVLDGMQLLIEGVNIKEDMIFVPLEWGQPLGPCEECFIEQSIPRYNTEAGQGWRLPTLRELKRSITDTKAGGFEYHRYYWVSDLDVPTDNTSGRLALRLYGDGGFCSHKGSSIQHPTPWLRLCRPKKLG